MIRHVSVVVPAADEERLIAACLRSVRRARAQLAVDTAGRVTSDAVVVLDDCHDGTARVVARFADTGVLTVAHHCIGRVRAAGSLAAVADRPVRGISAAQHWLANTDADSVVPIDWLSRMVSLADDSPRADSGVPADLVVGTVSPDDALAPPVRATWLAAHHQRDGHQHVHGANLGVRASSLQALGGWAPLITGEDVDLVTRAVRAGMRVVRTGDITVATSARLHSRVASGFAGYLRDIAEPAPTPTRDGPGTEVTGAA